MKTKDVKDTTATPATPVTSAMRVSGGASNVPEQPEPTPREWRQSAPSNVRSGLGGEDMPGSKVEAAPTDHPDYNSHATEYTPREAGLPMSVSAATVAGENRRYWGGSDGNVGPGGTDAPMLNGTSVREKDNQ